MKEELDGWAKIKREWQEECSRLYNEKAEEPKFTNSGIPLKPLYTHEDIQDIKCEEIGMPGIYPFTRGVSPLERRFEPIAPLPTMGYGLPEETRKRLDLYLDVPGLSGISICCDMPTYHGYDPDHPFSRGRVGQCGTSICNTQDLEKIFDGVPLDKIKVGINAPFAGLAMFALYIAYAEKRGIPPDRLKGTSDFSRMYKAAFGSHPCFKPKRAMKYIAEIVEYITKNNMKGWQGIFVDGYIIREQGGNAIQELAFVLAQSIGFTEQVIEDGFSADDCLSIMSCKLNGHNDFFEEIAKFRAFRKIWAKINREKFNCKNPESLNLKFVGTQTGGATLTAQQPLNNIVRVTVQTLAAIIGGTSWVDPAAYDEALAIPTEEAETIALRTSQILFHESNVKNVMDPMAGSYYIEHLTQKIEEEVYKMLGEIEKRGGFVKCWEDGWFRRQIEDESYKWRREVDSGKKIVVGVNKFITDKEIEVPIFRVDPHVEEIMVERVKSFKNSRDNRKVRACLDNLRGVAKNDGELMPPLLEAARADVTLGEMMDTLREVFGWHVYR